jgi:hypothetical protein
MELLYVLLALCVFAGVVYAVSKSDKAKSKLRGVYEKVIGFTKQR